jgi:hypothetical protein
MYLERVARLDESDDQGFRLVKLISNQKSKVSDLTFDLI